MGIVSSVIDFIFPRVNQNLGSYPRNSRFAQPHVQRIPRRYSPQRVWGRQSPQFPRTLVQSQRLGLNPHRSINPYQPARPVQRSTSPQPTLVTAPKRSFFDSMFSTTYNGPMQRNNTQKKKGFDLIGLQRKVHTFNLITGRR